MDMEDHQYRTLMQEEELAEAPSESNGQHGYDCPECGSPDIVRFSVLHLESQSKGLLSHNTVFVPPSKKSIATPVILTLFLFAMVFNANGAASLVSALAGIASIFYALHASRYNSNEYAAAYRQWEISFYCKKCGKVSQELDGV